MTHESISDFNKKNHGKCLVVPSGTSSHFMTGFLMPVILEQLISPALTLQRAKLLGFTVKLP